MNSITNNRRFPLLVPSTIQLLRFQFSFYLMPVFWYALTFVEKPDIGKVMLSFLLIHLFLYPASNGYNSFMDRDDSSIGSVEHPLPPTKQLYYAALVLDITGLLCAFLVGPFFAAGYFIYIVFSRLYSYRKIRLKKYPVVGYLVVIANQGALIFTITFLAASGNVGIQNVPLVPAIAASLLVGGFYPLTQVYQHETDKKDGVKTMSMLLGKKGSFVFCSIVYTMALLLMYFSYNKRDMTTGFFIILAFFVPVMAGFLKWMTLVWKDASAANFRNTMRMNNLAAICTNAAFITLLLFYYFD